MEALTLEKTTDWTFLSNYGHVILCLAENPGARLREVADRVGITERSAMRLITHLDEAGILSREKDGRRNHHLINLAAPLRHPIEEHCTVGLLLKMVLSPAALRKLEKDKAKWTDRQVS